MRHVLILIATLTLGTNAGHALAGAKGEAQSAGADHKAPPASSGPLAAPAAEQSGQNGSLAAASDYVYTTAQYPECSSPDPSLPDYTNFNAAMLHCMKDECGKSDCVADQWINFNLYEKNGTQPLNGLFTSDGVRCDPGVSPGRCTLRISTAFRATCPGKPDSSGRCKIAESLQFKYKIETANDDGVFRVVSEINEHSPIQYSLNTLRNSDSKQIRCPGSQSILGVDQYGVPICTENLAYKCAEQMETVLRKGCGATTSCTTPLNRGPCPSPAQSAGQGQSGTLHGAQN
jgi:hypothetical protein